MKRKLGKIIAGNNRVKHYRLYACLAFDDNCSGIIYLVVKIINHLINRQLQQHYCYKLELLCQEEGNYVFSLPKLCKHSTPRESSTKFYFRYRNIYSIYLLTLYSVAYALWYWYHEQNLSEHSF